MELTQFEELGLSEDVIKTLKKKGFEEPTEIQSKTIPVLLNSNQDIIAQAQTGTGKTAAFGLPLIEKLDQSANHIQALILAPTRELAIQVSEEINSLKGKKKLTVIPIYGGQSIVDQQRRLKNGVDIVVGTPGRLYDMIKRRNLVLDKVRYVVLDEADEMLNMGFIDEVEDILKRTNKDRRTLLFSATMPSRIMKVAEKYMNEYDVIKAKKGKLTVDSTDQIYFEVRNSEKFESLCRIIDTAENFYALVFCRTKVAVDELSNKLVDRGYSADAIHGDISQLFRERILAKFKKQQIRILVATDVAARGIDVNDLSHVINYSLPQDTESYIHRIGRTGRAGKKGIAITFISSAEYRKLMHITKDAKTSIRREKLPNVAELIKIKKKRIKSEVGEIIESGKHLDYGTIALELLKEGSPEDVVAALLKYSMEDELDAKSYKEIKEVKEKRETSVDRQGTTRLFISFGRKDGITPPKLVKMINNESKVPGGKINEVKVMDSFSFVTVPFKEAEIILHAFNNNRDKSKKPLVERAKKEKPKTGKSRRGKKDFKK